MDLEGINEVYIVLFPMKEGVLAPSSFCAISFQNASDKGLAKRVDRQVVARSHDSR